MLAARSWHLPSNRSVGSGRACNPTRVPMILLPNVMSRRGEAGTPEAMLVKGVQIAPASPMPCPFNTLAAGQRCEGEATGK